MIHHPSFPSQLEEDKFLDRGDGILQSLSRNDEILSPLNGSITVDEGWIGPYFSLPRLKEISSLLELYIDHQAQINVPLPPPTTTIVSEDPGISGGKNASDELLNLY